ncbi:MAG: alpha/beta hydrolase [Elusimicrobia bacterium]|nr:alpha/beta hydrolase [Elusimicrobiota bacterium]
MKNSRGAPKALIALLIFLSPVVAGAQARKIDGMYVNVYGDPKNQPIVFIHGGPGYNSWDFEFTTALPLSKRGYYVVVYDQRGQGRSDAADSKRFNYRQYADDLKEIIDRLKLKNPVLIGHSHGGPIAIKFDEYYPHVAKKIVLVSAPVVFWESMRSLFENCSRNYENAGQYKKQFFVGGIYYQLFLDSQTPVQQITGLIGEAFQAAGDCGLYKVRYPSQAAQELWLKYGENRLKTPLSGMTTAMPGFLSNENYVHFNGLDYVFAHQSKFCGIYGDEDGLFTPLSRSVIRNALQSTSREAPFRLIHGASHDVFVDQQPDFFKALKETCGL